MYPTVENKEIVWSDTLDEKFKLNYFLKFKCSNPRAADESLSPYYDKVFLEVCKTYAQKNKIPKAKKIFGFPREDFMSAIDTFINSNYDFREFPILMFDLTYYICNKYYCATRYDIFVMYFKELKKILR